MMLTASQFMFYFFALAIVIFSILTVTSQRILRAATYLLFVLISTAGIYFLLNYQFLAAVQITLYAGGIVVLIIFSILLTSHVGVKFDMVGWKKRLATGIAVAIGAILVITTILQYQFEASTEAARAVEMRWIGLSLLSYEKEGFVLPFEVISILLLASMIGAIIIARKEEKNESNN
ncbi:MAG: NADH-quinone oxidoreductase subunit J [Bacteroidales bacterium]|nr:NADH-quinone oxidoreductase subunit J [Bacteroidales bacterium]